VLQARSFPCLRCFGKAPCNPPVDGQWRTCRTSMHVGGVHDAQADWAIYMTPVMNIGPYHATAVNGFCSQRGIAEMEFTLTLTQKRSGSITTIARYKKPVSS
jgi:hypothetical protein